ncbi:MAG: preprotein translocase subunit SecE [Chloracidobacterium sp.]|nr:preprotein translocase subunit SecE [Chloracidobacterium sp.]MDW8218887.1 preprotein translocase subunit SecE [Acidobacteriota bacterium]
MERASETAPAAEAKPSVLVSKVTNWWSSSVQFLRDVRAEMQQVVWPTRQEVYDTTLIVIGIVTFFGVFLWTVDVVVTRILSAILKWLS